MSERKMGGIAGLGTHYKSYPLKLWKNLMGRHSISMMLHSPFACILAYYNDIELFLFIIIECIIFV